eukprot:jgi/Tetstr1/422120/TSEL_012976.t1
MLASTRLNTDAERAHFMRTAMAQLMGGIAIDTARRGRGPNGGQGRGPGHGRGLRPRNEATESPVQRSTQSADDTMAETAACISTQHERPVIIPLEDEDTAAEATHSGDVYSDLDEEEEWEDAMDMDAKVERL